jgi:hypothetical protein
VAPESLDFGRWPYTTLSRPSIVTVTNTGTWSMRISEIALSGSHGRDFALRHECVAVLRPGASCPLPVTFAPSGPGPRDAALTLHHDANGGPRTVTLTGTGIRPSPGPWPPLAPPPPLLPVC